MGGAFPQGEPEFNIKTDIPAARKLFAEWPTPIVASGYEVGEALPFPASSIENDFSWSPAHPVVEAYKAYRPMPYDARTWDMAKPSKSNLRAKHIASRQSPPKTKTIIFFS